MNDPIAAQQTIIAIDQQALLGAFDRITGDLSNPYTATMLEVSPVFTGPGQSSTAIEMGRKMNSMLIKWR